jgi:hypothetical protein
VVVNVSVSMTTFVIVVTVPVLPPDVGLGPVVIGPEELAAVD